MTIVVGLVAISACGEAPSTSATGPSVRDSAGVTIVENEAPDAVSHLVWSIGVEPLLSIGATDGDPEEHLFRVEDALRLPDGRILIANGGTSQVRVYRADGRYLEAWGREGEGPGEFTQLTDLHRWPGDSVAAWDFGQHRLTLFDLAGNVGRTLSVLPGEGLGGGRIEGVLGDRSVVTASLVSFGRDDRTTGLVRRSREFARIGSAGARLSSFGRFPDEEYYVRAEVGAILRHPFRRSVHAAVWGDRVAISPNDRYEIHVFSPEGSVEMIVRRDHDLAQVTPADMERYVDGRLDEADPEQRPTMLTVFEGIPPVESFPAFARIIVDATGDLWVKEYEHPDRGRSQWSVFDADGRIRGRIETPAGLTIREIGADYLLGLTTDDMEVESVQLWRLTRESP